MRTLVLLLILATPPALAAAPPASSPATTRLADMESLLDGSIRYVMPPKWELISKTPDGKSASWRSGESGALIITVTPQDQQLQDSAKDQIAMIIGKGIRESAKKENHDLVLQPRVEKDDRFFLKVRDAQRIADDKIVDRIQIYRLMGLNLVHIAATAWVESPEQSRPIHEEAERLLDSMVLSRGLKRSVYPHAQLRLIVPLDWKEQKPDNANGLVATLTDPKDASKQLIVRARVIPKDARTDTTKRDALLGRMIDEERKLPPLTLADAKNEQPGAGSGGGVTYLRQIRTPAQKNGQAIRVETRYFVVGDVLVSVRSLAPESDADALASIADKFAADIKPIKEESKP